MPRCRQQKSVMLRRRDRVVEKCVNQLSNSTRHYDNPPPPSNQPKDMAWEMYTRLPRELRNNIYTFYLDSPSISDPSVIVRRTSSRHAKSPFALLIRQQSGLHSYQWLQDPIFTSIATTQTLGSEVSRELLETYYWTRTFRFSHTDLPLLHAFLHSDTHAWGVLPVHYARRVQLQIQPFACAKMHPHFETRTRWVQDEAWKAAGEALALIPARRMEVEVLVDLTQGSMLEAEYERYEEEEVGLLLVEVMRIVKREKERGVRIKVVFSETWDEK